MTVLDRLESMRNKAFLYQGQEVVILNYAENTGDDGDQIEIYLNNGKTLEWAMTDLILKIDRFKPISNTVIILANERMNQVSTINPSVINDLSKTLLAEIEAVKADPSRVAQSKQIFQGINTLTNLAKTELEYRKYIDSQDKK